jgi:hypothetical protein
VDANSLGAIFGTGFSPVKFLKCGLQAVSVPATPVTDHAADVQEQQHPVEATWDSATGTLRVAQSATGDGVWIPWLGQGSATSNRKGWGTYTKAITAKTWVVTGPFSGCYAAAFQAGPRFAHLITPGSGYTAATVDGQIAAIRAATGAGVPVKIDMNGAGEGFIFFMKIGGRWVYRRVFCAPGSGSVMQISAQPTNLF